MLLLFSIHKDLQEDSGNLRRNYKVEYRLEVAGLQTRAITEGAMLAAITVLLAFLALYIGFVGLIIPVPLALLVYRHGFRAGVIVAVASALLSALVLNTLLLAVELIITGLIGMALGMALKERFTFFQIMLVGTAASTAAAVLKVMAYSVIFGQNLLELYLESWSRTSEQWLVIWENLGLSPEMIQQYEEMLTAVPAMVQILLPVILVGSGIVRAAATLFVIRVVLRRLGDHIPWFPPFITWTAPWYMVWGFIVGRLFVLISFYFPGEIWETIAVNLDVFFLYAFFVQGLAIVWFFLDRYRVPKFIRVVFVLFLFQPGSFLILLVALVGLLDTWLDFRKVRQKGQAQD